MSSKFHQVVMRPKEPTLSIMVTGTAASIAIPAHVDAVRLYLSGATADAFFSITGTATTTSTPIAPGTYWDIPLRGAGSTVALSAIGTDGTLYATPLTQ